MTAKLNRAFALAFTFSQLAMAGMSVLAAGNTSQAPGSICEREMMAASRKYRVPLNVLYAVGMTETGVRGSMQPYAMNVDGRTYAAHDLNDALRKFESFERQGATYIDLGCMQINHHFHAAKFTSVSAMFDPAGNVDYAAHLLADLKTRHQTWTMAVARYNAGPNNNPAQKRYVCAVIANMVATGFGSWTAGAKSFCSRSPVASLRQGT